MTGVSNRGWQRIGKSPYKKSITFNLKKGIKFHDGTDFNAEAVKFNLEGVKTAGRPGTKDWSSIDVVDDYTLRVTLAQYSNIALTRFSGGGGAMISPTAFKTKGKDWANWNPVGTGPFQLSVLSVTLPRSIRSLTIIGRKASRILMG